MEERPHVYSGETQYLHNAASPRLLSENVELLEITRVQDRKFHPARRWAAVYSHDIQMSEIEQLR